MLSLHKEFSDGREAAIGISEDNSADIEVMKTRLWHAYCLLTQPAEAREPMATPA